MKTVKLLLIIGLSCAAFSTPSSAAIIPGLFTTGVDNGGNVLALGALDPHYVVLENASNNAVTMTNIPGTYIPNAPTSLWVWENASGQPTNVTRTFRTTFSLTGLDPSTAMISGIWATDNFGLDILVNGTSTGNTSPTFTAYSNFSVNSGFVSGTNTLDFVVQDVGSISGFRVGSISGTADSMSAIPESASIAIWTLLGMAFLGHGRRFNRKN